MTESDEPRRYVLAPPDRTAVLIGLRGTQLAVLVIGVIGAAMLIRSSLLLAIVVLAVGAILPFRPTWEDQPVMIQLPVIVRFAFRRPFLRSAGRGGPDWFAPLPLLPLLPVAAPEGVQPAGRNWLLRQAAKLTKTAPDVPVASWPPCLAGITILPVVDSGLRPGPIAVTHDKYARDYSAAVVVSGVAFELSDAGEKDSLIGRYSQALAPACREDTPVVNLRWSEWSRPAGANEQLAYLAEHGDPNPVPAARADYDELLAEAAPTSTRHEVVFTLTCRPPHKWWQWQDRQPEGIATLTTQLRLLCQRLERADLTVSAPLDPEELALAIRRRLDLGSAAALDRRARNSDHPTGIPVTQAGPMSTDPNLKQWWCDDTCHRAFHVAEWPRTQIGAGFLFDLLNEGSVRSLALNMQPRSPKTSRRAVAIEGTKVESSANQLEKYGFTAHRARTRRQLADIERREAVMAAGSPELRYVGTVVVSAVGIAALDEACDQVCQAAEACGVELRPLHGRHAAGTVTMLPGVGRGIQRVRTP